jgi:hypothetical protein
MIYCVVPEELAPELLPKLESYYADDPNVQVIVDRRRAERRSADPLTAEDASQRELRDRRRARIAGDFPPIDADPSV